MKKRVLALVLGGVLAAGSFCLSSSLAVYANSDPFEEDGRDEWEKSLDGSDDWDCKGCTTDRHITSSQITAGNGTITVTVTPVYSDDNKRSECNICIVNEKQTPVQGLDGEYYYSSDLLSGNVYKPAKWSQFVDPSNTATFDGLPNGTTYYVYCIIRDTHGGEYGDHNVHYAKYLGTATPAASTSGSTSSGNASSNSSGSSGWAAFEDKVNSQIETAESGSTVVINDGVNTLSNRIMKELLAKEDVSLRMEFTYEDTDYVIIIPAGEALDNDIPWYGPLYLAANFGNSAGTEASRAGSYVVKSGDTLSWIAVANGTTLNDLLAKNPQIRDANKIFAGEAINLR